MRPAWQCLDALAPDGNRRMILADVETEFFDRVKQISCERDIGDGRPVAEQEFSHLKPFVDDAEIAVDAAPEECVDSGISRRLHPISQEAIRPEKSIDLLIVKNDPAQRFQLLILALWQILAGAAREV